MMCLCTAPYGKSPSQVLEANIPQRGSGYDHAKFFNFTPYLIASCTDDCCVCFQCSQER